MDRTRRYILFSLCTILVSCCLGACMQEPRPPVKVGTNVWPGYEPFYLSRQLGYYDNSRVRLVEYKSATEVIRAFQNGAIAAAALTLDEALLLSQYTQDLSMILVIDYSNGADVVLGKPYIQNLRDLKRKRVGVENTALGSFMLTRALQSAGMSPADVVVVPIDVSGHVEAFNAGKVDAVVTFEPVRTELLGSGARLLFDSSRIPGEVIDVLVVRRSVLEKRPGDIKYILDGWFLALDYIDKDPRDAARRMSDRLGLSADQTLESYKGLYLLKLKDNQEAFSGGGRRLVATADKTAKVMLDNGLIQKPVDGGYFIDGRFMGGTRP